MAANTGEHEEECAQKPRSEARGKGMYHVAKAIGVKTQRHGRHLGRRDGPRHERRAVVSRAAGAVARIAGGQPETKRLVLTIAHFTGGAGEWLLPSNERGT
ncbi:hypothetical protein [Gemmatimonas sp.]